MEASRASSDRQRVHLPSVSFMKSIDWSLLRSFLAVVEPGSLSAPAARIGTTQPTLGRHVHELRQPWAGAPRKPSSYQIHQDILQISINAALQNV